MVRDMRGKAIAACNGPSSYPALKEIMMNTRLNEVIVHIDEVLDEDTLHRLEDGVRQDAGVVSVGHNPEKPHILMVVYDSDSTHASSLLHSFKERGLHAQVVGM
jgi:hypothetical protein